MQKLFLIVSILFLGCKKMSTHIDISFYHWKSSFSMDKNTLQRLENLACKKIYLRIFDVDFEDNQTFAQPIGIFNLPKDSLNNQLFKQYQIVPTIFITNRTFLKIRENQIDTLSILIYQKALTFSNALTEGGKTSVKMWQFDCDWTSATREKYFLLLKKIQYLQQKNNIQTSVTIRLHQLKFFEREGVPPVSTGTLMAYNVGDLDNLEGENSILSLPTLEKFLPKKKNYPLPLEVALPIFSWGVVLRDGQAVLLIHGLEESDFLLPSVTPYFQLKPTNETQTFVCQENIYFKNHYLYKNDEIRLETITPKTLEKCAERLAKTLPSNPNRSIIFYHLDSIHLQRYSDETFKNIKNIFQHHH
jgi:hypothetical protein